MISILNSKYTLLPQTFGLKLRDAMDIWTIFIGGIRPEIRHGLSDIRPDISSSRIFGRIPVAAGYSAGYQ